MRQFGQLEAEVMERLWACDRPQTVREVLEDIQRERRIAYTTVMTVMDNLYGKGFLARELDGRAYRYHAVQSREEHTAGLMEEVLSSSGNRGGALMRFVQQIPADDLARLRAAIRDLEREERNQ